MTVENLGKGPPEGSRPSPPDRSLPWHGMVLPVGALEPGETGRATTVTQVSPSSLQRRLVSITVVADDRPRPPRTPCPCRWRAPAPPLSVAVRLVPEGETHHRAEVRIENLGQENLVDVRARALPEDTQVEPWSASPSRPTSGPASRPAWTSPFACWKAPGTASSWSRVATAVQAGAPPAPRGSGVWRRGRPGAAAPRDPPAGGARRLPGRAGNAVMTALALTAWLDGE